MPWRPRDIAAQSGTQKMSNSPVSQPPGSKRSHGIGPSHHDRSRPARTDQPDNGRTAASNQRVRKGTAVATFTARAGIRDASRLSQPAGSTAQEGRSAER